MNLVTYQSKINFAAIMLDIVQKFRYFALFPSIGCC